MRRRTVLAVLAALALTAAGACAGDDDGAEGEGDVTTSTTAEPRPEGPAASIEGPLTAGNGVNLVTTRAPDLAAAGWVEEEHVASGSATSYRAIGDLPADGTFELEPADTAGYRTRIVVRRPARGEDFSGTVVVEWLNVSAGFDASPDFTYLGDELVRAGHAWVGVSAQRIGVEGGDSLVGLTDEPTGGLRGADPARYGDLRHPGDAYAYDIYTQIGRALRAGEGLGELEPEVVLAVGESQSAYMLTTYANGVQPLTRAFDGFLVHSRGASAAPLGEPGSGIDLAASRGGEPTRIRTDLDVPVIVLQTETDVLGLLRYLPARQPDTDRFRLWEVAGTAHADAYQLGPAAGIFDCGVPVNAGPHHFVVKAALRHLDAWVRTGEAPPRADRLEVDESGDEPVFVRDADGIVRGGIRTPQVDVPVAVHSGEPGPDPSAICLLLGSSIPLPPERLGERYGSRDAYLAAYEAAADDAIRAGFVLDDDRAELLADAQPDAIPG